MSNSTSALITLACSLLISGLLVWLCIRLRLGEQSHTTLKAAQLSLGYMVDWAKWMAGIQTAVIALLGTLLLSKASLNYVSMGRPSQVFAIATVVFMGFALLGSAWVLSCASSVALRFANPVGVPLPSASEGADGLAFKEFDI